MTLCQVYNREIFKGSFAFLYPPYSDVVIKDTYPPIQRESPDRASTNHIGTDLHTGKIGREPGKDYRPTPLQVT